MAIYSTGNEYNDYSKRVGESDTVLVLPINERCTRSSC